MSANPSAVPTPALEDVIAALEKMTPEQQRTAITLLHLVQTASDTITPMVGDLTTQERTLLALINGLKTAPGTPDPNDRRYMHPALEVLLAADDTLTDFSCDAWERDPNDARQIAARWDEARDLITRARNIARVAVQLDK